MRVAGPVRVPGFTLSHGFDVQTVVGASTSARIVFAAGGPAQAIEVAILCRVPADDLLFREAVALVGESVTEFLVESGRERADMLLADRTEFVLDPAAFKAFSAALDQPAEAKPALVELMRRPPSSGSWRRHRTRSAGRGTVARAHPGTRPEAPPAGRPAPAA